MTPEQLREVLVEVAARAARVGDLPDEAEAGPPAGPVFRPVEVRPSGLVADWVTPVAQRWAPQLGLEPRELARVLAVGLTGEKPVAAVEVAPSGLLAITLSDAARSEVIDTVLSQEDTYALRPGGRADVPDERPGQRGPGDPVRRVQLAHARLCRLARNARSAGVEERRPRREELTHATERPLLVALADLPQRLDAHEGDAAQTLRALTDLADLADAWTLPLRPTAAGAEVEPVHGARLALADAARVVLRNGLARVGAAAPERM